MRFIALFPLLCVIGSFVLSLLCILAGMNSSFMENFEQVTFNTSQLGTAIINKVASAEGLPTASSVPSSVVNAIPPSATGDVPPALASAIAGQAYTTILNQIAEDLNIHDFYKIHILTYCEGYYEPGPIVNSSNSSPSQNLTFCSPATPFSFFNATQVLQNELKPGISLDSLQWPSQIQDAISAMEVVQKVQFVLYCIGCGFSGLAVLEAVLAFLLDGRLSAVCNAILDIFAFIALVIASGCGTAFIYVVTNAVNNYGAQVNVQAYRGTNFLIITWIATVLPLIASIGWCIDFCVGPDRRGYKRTRQGPF